jgi:DNA-binding NarL/FixJ family response regulator
MLTAAAILLLHDEIKNFIIANNNKVLKISQFTEITERDKVYLKSIFKGVKFETIAKENNISLGSLKNRMTEIYRIINVADKTELLIKYTDCE